MALQDLTPQLRTRLSRMERAVGWFVMLALLSLAFGFVYYLYNTAERKGWFVTKARYFTFVHTATGLKVGDPVRLMGFEVGQITQIEGMDPFNPYDVYVEFNIKSPYYGYLWTQGSLAKISAAGFLENRVLEVTKGTNGFPDYIEQALRDVSVAEAEHLPDWTNWALAQEVYEKHGTQLVAQPFESLTKLPAIAAAGHTNFRILNRKDKRRYLTGVWNDKQARYDYYAKTDKYWLPSEESPAVTEQAQKLVAEVEAALPGIFNLTNQLTSVLSNGTSLTSNLNFIALTVRPAVSNLAAATAHLDQPGALGEWLLPTNINRQLEGTLSNANTNLSAVVENLGRSLDSLADITSNLNHQVESNTNLLSAISQTIVHADQFVQGLKHHWLFRSAFKSKDTNAPPPVPVRPLHSPKDRSG